MNDNVGLNLEGSKAQRTLYACVQVWSRSELGLGSGKAREENVFFATIVDRDLFVKMYKANRERPQANSRQWRR